MLVSIVAVLPVALALGAVPPPVVAGPPDTDTFLSLPLLQAASASAAKATTTIEFLRTLVLPFVNVGTLRAELRKTRAPGGAHGAAPGTNRR